jgi:hypothetical protein
VWWLVKGLKLTGQLIEMFSRKKLALVNSAGRYSAVVEVVII